MAERVGQHGDLAPGVDPDFRLRPRAGGDGAVKRGFDVVDDHVDMHRRPMAIVVSGIGPGANRAGRLLQKVEPDRQAAELRGLGAEAPRYGQTESLLVEGDGLIEVRNVDVDQQIHARQRIRTLSRAKGKAAPRGGAGTAFKGCSGSKALSPASALALGLAAAFDILDGR